MSFTVKTNQESTFLSRLHFLIWACDCLIAVYFKSRVTCSESMCVIFHVNCNCLCQFTLLRNGAIKSRSPTPTAPQLIVITLPPRSLLLHCPLKPQPAASVPPSALARRRDGNLCNWLWHGFTLQEPSSSTQGLLPWDWFSSTAAFLRLKGKNWRKLNLCLKTGYVHVVCRILMKGGTSSIFGWREVITIFLTMMLLMWNNFQLLMYLII